MTAFMVTALSQGAQRALTLRAHANGRTPDQEARAILEELLVPSGRLQLGTALAELSKASGLTNADVDALEAARAADPTPPVWFG